MTHVHVQTLHVRAILVRLMQNLLRYVPCYPFPRKLHLQAAERKIMSFVFSLYLSSRLT
jgi:hypothetical protein